MNGMAAVKPVCDVVDDLTMVNGKSWIFIDMPDATTSKQLESVGDRLKFLTQPKIYEIMQTL
jgi:hypothetical protein